MAMLLLATTVLALLHHSNGHLIRYSASDFNNDTDLVAPLELRSLTARSSDPTDMGWVANFAAPGDSFTAGIGSGNQLGSIGGSDWSCSRYDLSYPILINNLIGPAVKTFQFAACSGARSVQIFDQVNSLKNGINLAIMTAGGNDLCLASMIKKCVMLPYNGEDTCNAVIQKAQDNINTILKPNIKQVLKALDSKMAKDGIVVYNGYAQYFNTDNEDCATKQKWSMAKWLPQYWFSTGLTLTVDRRKKFNALVVQINNAIRDVVHDVADEVGYTIGFSDWDPWAYTGVKGQMCDPSSTGVYPDPNQPDLQFFKPDSHIGSDAHDELRRRLIEAEHFPIEFDENGVDKSVYESLLWKSPDPRAAALHKLDKRAPAPPDCPGDKDMDPTLGLGMPDSFGKFFHPNELGHQTVASFALAKVIDLRAKVLGVGSQSCALTDVFKCWQKEGSKAYATADPMNANYKDFCNAIPIKDHQTGWTYEKTYLNKTLDEQTFSIKLSDKVGAIDKNLCLESFDRIINGCDGNDPKNPMNWKFGGEWQRGEYTYTVSVKRTNRPWPPIKEAYGSCHGQYYVLFSGYTMRGAGFSSWDSGQKTLLPCMKSCLGDGVTNFNLKYFDAPDKDGMEWQLDYRTPIWTNARCFDNNKVQFCAGGFTHGCGGTG